MSKCPDNSYYEKNYHHYGKNAGHITPHEILHFQPLTGVGFLDVIIPAPALFQHAEQYNYQRTKRKYQVADDKIFEIQDTCSFAKRLNEAQQIESKAARQGERKQENSVYNAGLLSSPAEQILRACRDLLKNSQYGGQRRK